MNITKKAQDELLKALKGFDKPQAGVHLYSAPGCCGPSIQMDIAHNIGTEETMVSKDGIDFFIANDLLPQFADLVIDYGENGFKLIGLKKSGGCCS